MKILTDLKQLIGKTIKYISLDDNYESSLFVLTENGSVALITFEAWENDGFNSVRSVMTTDELDLFMECEPKLLRHGLITNKEMEAYYQQIYENSKIESEAIARKNKMDRYEQYLKLKKEFEVEYKL